MKKYVYLLMIICFSISFFYGFNKNNKLNPVFDDNGFNSYVIVFTNGIKINDYKNFFKLEDSNNYYISSFSFEDTFHDKMNNDINNITINGGNYLDSLSEYIDKYIDILNIYNKELEISRIYSGDIRISKIYINCTSDIYYKLLNLNNYV